MAVMFFLDMMKEERSKKKNITYEVGQEGKEFLVYRPIIRAALVPFTSTMLCAIRPLFFTNVGIVLFVDA